ncbi:MarR family transcriptional regulator [Streptomyces sp. NBC_01387]|uniref:MarR family transcriptional regulator n=1 Tax=unclassified Streptomyces TaxID=2593676 RepID=UPI0020249630|nr:MULTISPECIES: MarR family transcriptional regulator [unclassified Streptomyces]WSC21743.1 MarR family transcriptional regulator [Streptomyces sp. NBC_01766]WSV55699.1 MarR family transcriptional regulator [Streptomyces sp. NBC_01014]
MQTPVSLLLPLLRSQTQGELLALLYLHPEQEYSLSELAAQLQVSVATVSREADRLGAAGLIKERRYGNMRLVRAATDTVVSRPLTDLLAATFGPLPVLGELLAEVAGVAEAYIYGSWAARHEGVPGPVPRDIDVLVIGTADEDDLDDAARSAESRLGREVNIHRVSRRSWAETDGGPFLETVRTQPMVPLVLPEE